MINKIAHFVWIGDNPMPKVAQDSIDNLECNGWEVMIHSYLPDDSRYDFLRSIVDELIAKKLYAFASDIIRVAVLHRYGGLYLDTDVEIVDVDKLDYYLQFNKVICGWEIMHKIGTGIIFSHKGAEVLMEIILDYDCNRNIITLLPEEVNNFTKIYRDRLVPNTNLFTSWYMKRPEDFIVMPISVFCAKNWYNGHDYTDHTTVTRHLYDNSWNN